MTMEASPKIQAYFKRMDDEVNRAYSIANETKKKGFDPDGRVMIPLAKNMAERVEGLIATVAPEIVGKGVVARIAELEAQYGLQDWRIAFKIAEEVACEKFCKFEDKKKAIETGIRMGFAYVTVGVVSSPLEGFAGLSFNKRNDNGKEYFALFYSGPVRSAGGTGAAVSVLIADYVRKKLGYAEYDPDETEVKRACIEVADYHERVTNLQYRPSSEEVAFMASHIPVQVDGDGTAEINVSNYKGLKRIGSDRIRGGFCLVIAECLAAKAKKLWKQLSKWGKDFDMEQWNFLAEFLELQDKIKAKGAVAKTDEKKAPILPDFTFIKDLVAGRPIIAYPLRNGGLRLRYGRSRATGLSSDAITPATMVILDSFIGIGTQLKTERPGKSTTISVCDMIDGPIVKLNSGSVKRIETIDEAKQYVKDVAEIIYLGDLLVNYGDFLNRGHKLVPCGFNEEWWALCIEKQMKEKPLSFDEIDEKAGLNPGKTKEAVETPLISKFNFSEAMEMSKLLDIPLHPRWIYYWNSISKEQFMALYGTLKNAAVEKGKIVIALPSPDAKRALELIGIEHTAVGNEHVVIENDDAVALMENLGGLLKEPSGETPLELANSISSVKIKDKCGTFIGARMGRPEKAKMRKLKSSPHVLFPVGEEGGRLRSFQAAIGKGKITSQFPIRYCKSCGKKTVYTNCDECGSESERKYFCPKCNKEMDNDICPLHGKCLLFKKESIDINFFYNNALRKAKLQQQPEIVKGIRGTSNVEHIPEHILKGILRAKHNLNVNKEGTIRYDMTEMTCTHFKPKEVGASVEKLREMGYTLDCYGKPLEDNEQILELNAQDVILPACDAALEEGADNVLYRIACFIDDVLVSLYGFEPYYKLETKKDLIGQLCVAMSPHTAAGIVCRIVGFSKTQGFLAHPLLHCIMRRDCDGDEAAVMMLMDHLLNFSKKFLPDKRGATQDAPLLITTKLIPAEVDDMVFDMDTAWKYPLELYELAEQYKYPSDLKTIETFRQRLGKESQYEGIGFTHDTSDFNTGVLCSSYKSIPSMKEKVQKQMILAEKIRAADADDTARLVIERHFIRDIKGNLRKFSTQEFRCVSCNEKYRRPPLCGKCMKCGGKLLFTISEGSVVKYLEPVEDLIKRYKLPAYLRQSVEITRKRIESVFGKESEKQEGLNKWFS
ncbi:MAG: DNA polymerase II large subunit [Nanoarchaeota archaeon]|nr:DNA polymerase II large subunit [Nanoarchaeota archaeon]